MTARAHRLAHRFVLVLVLAALGCGSEAAPAAIAPEPSAALAAAHEATPAAPGAPATAPSPPADLELAVFSLPSDWTPSIEEVEVSRTTVGPERADAYVPVLDIQPAELAASVNGTIERALTSAVGEESADGEYVHGECRVTLASAQLVSMLCVLEGSGGRTGFDRSGFALSLRIVDGAVRPVLASDAFAPDVDLSALVARACHAAYEEEDEAFEGIAEWCDTEVYGLTFGTTGLEVHSLDTPQLDGMSVEIAYDDPALAGHFLLDGPLGAVLPIGERTTRTFSPDQLLAGELAARCDVRWALGPARPLDDLMLEADRAREPAGIGALVASGEGFRAAYQQCTPTLDAFRQAETTAREIAGGAIERLPSDVTPLPITRYQTTEELALRAAPSTDGALLRTLSQGTTVMGIEGTIDGHVSAVGAPGTWTRVAVGDGVGGWVAGRYLRSSSVRCSRPSLEETAAALPAEAAGASVIFGEQGTLVFLSARGRDRSWLVVSESCSLTPVVRTIAIPGRLEAVQVYSARDAASAILLVTSMAVDVGEPGFDGVLRIMLVAPEATEPGWSMEVPAHATLPSDARGSIVRGGRVRGVDWVVQVRAPGAEVRRARWDGTAFVESTGR